MIMLKNRKFKGQATPEWATAVTKLNKFWYWEESVNQKPGDRFCRCDLDFEDYTRTYDQSTYQGFDAAYLLPPPETEDDPLPPAPEEVMYVGLNSVMHQQLDLWSHSDTLRIKVGDGQLDWSSRVVILGPDAALQLAHDLRRMAMDIKRKQKQEQVNED